jgi:uncharacterized repeat protein (TIGR01451 family)
LYHCKIDQTMLMRKLLYTFLYLIICCTAAFTQASITIEKRINGNDADNPLDVVINVPPSTPPNLNLEYIVTNTGTLTLTNIVVTDDIMGAIGVINALAPNTSQTLTSSAIAALGLNNSTANTLAQPVDAGGSPVGGTVSATDAGIYTGVFLEVRILGLPSIACNGSTLQPTLEVRMLGGSNGIQIRNIIGDFTGIAGNLVPYGQYSTNGNDPNANGILDYLDANGDGIGDEFFRWNPTVTLTQATNFIFSEAGEVWANNTFTSNIGNVDTHTVDFNPAQASVASITGNNVVCAGVSSVFTAAGGGNYFWSTSVTTASITVNTAGTYTVTVTSANGCTSIATRTLTVNPLPTAAITGNNVVCAGVSSVFTAAGGTTYIWSNSATTSSITVTAGTYTVTVTAASGCTNTATRTLAVNPLPVITVSVTNATCGNANGSITATGGTTYFWSNSSFTATINNLVAGTYTVTATNANGCAKTATASVSNTGGPAISISLSVTNIGCNQINTGAINGTVTGGTAAYTYDWSHLAGLSNPEDLSNLPAGTYCVTVTDINGCFSTSCATITQPAATILTSTSCENTASVQPLGGTPPFEYLWNNGATTAAANFQPGTYTVTVMDASGCTLAQTFAIAPNPDPCTYITGFVRSDTSYNCIGEIEEPGIGNWFVQAQSSTQTFYGITDSLGNYTIRVASGNTYNVTIATDISLPAVLCAPQSLVVNVPQPGDTATANFAVQGLTPDCAQMTVDISVSNLRRCFSDNYFFLEWCNNSTFATDSAYIDLTLDENMSVFSASYPFTSLGSNTFRFNLGTVAPNQCGTFWVNTYISCNAALGQTLCATATIYPNEPCKFNPNWSGAEVDLRAECLGDSVQFVLKNIGTGAMNQALDYIVIEDGIMTYMQQTAPLAVQDSMIVKLPADGSTWRLEAKQEPFFPGNRVPVLSVEGCSSSGPFSTGWVNQFITSAQDPWQSTFCDVVTGSYDPNDKKGFPVGYGNEHFIKPGTRIDYRIRFQNTGTDTAFAVVIRDTLSPWLDPLTLRTGVSSHPYHFEFGGENVLVFDFKGIMLPDSNVNVAASQGFVNFSIVVRDSTPLATTIPNKAAIYFDFNEPIITNETIHRTGMDFISVGFWEPSRPKYEVQVVPNPMGSQAVITLKGINKTDGDFRLKIYNLQGSLVQELQGASPWFTLRKDALISGVYLFGIEQDGQILGTGKIIIR